VATIRQLFGIPKPTPTLPIAIVFARGIARVWTPAVELDLPLIFSWYEAI
jgi:hypothetical protein